MRFNWKGEQIKAKMRRAAIEGINATMAKAALYAKQNHPGWGYGFEPKHPRSRPLTGSAERSIKPQTFAAQQGARIVGQWGSKGVNYMRPLEFLHGSALRDAAKAVYPQLAGEIKKRFV